MYLFDLAPELLTLIFEHVSGAKLRDSVDNLLISRRWYQSAHPIYINDLDFSTLCLSSYDLERLPPPSCTLAKAIQARTKRLSIRLNGHPSTQSARNPWYHGSEKDGDAEADGNDDEDDEIWYDWTTAGPAVEGTTRHQPKYVWRNEERTLLKWRKLINERLIDLASMLPSFAKLEELSFEGSSEYDTAKGPRWDWLFGSSMEKCIESIPVGLKALTLDTAGSTVVKSKDDRTPMHLCPLIAKRLHDFQHVRIRMRHICPQILATEDHQVNTSKLESLVVRLSIPFLPPATYETHNGHTEFDALSCDVGRREGLPHDMIAAGTLVAKSAPRSKSLRISYRISDINLGLADCVMKKYMHVGAEVFSYEDDGREWNSWEDADEDLMLVGDFT